MISSSASKVSSIDLLYNKPAAAELIKTLDTLLGLNVDPEPLYETAKIFEEKFNKLIEKSQHAKGEIHKKQMNYVG